MVGPYLRAQAAMAPRPINSLDLQYQGGYHTVGITPGKPKIYLVFWGTQWGTQGTNTQGYATFSGDPDGLAPYTQALFAGLGTGGEKWSGIPTQYCQGVAIGTYNCKNLGTEVGYPTGGALAGVWEDTSAAAPAAATPTQLGQEAVAAAEHFGNTTFKLNRSVQYDIISPTGTDPDDYQSNGFCAWHDWTGDSFIGVHSAVGPIAFTNEPYVPDVGYSCGAGFVNAGNVLDGVSIVNGHEYAETITDQFPAYGWIDTSGEEIGDLCAWNQTAPGQVQDVTFTTGTFAMQGLWSNNSSGGSCQIAHFNQ
jgi:hypothetical protein